LCGKEKDIYLMVCDSSELTKLIRAKLLGVKSKWFGTERKNIQFDYLWLSFCCRLRAVFNLTYI
jgi:hypothetical protein